MGTRKRNAAIIISDDDEEDENFSIKSKSSYSKSKYVAKSASGVNPKRSKRGLITNSCSRLYEQSHSNGFDEIKRICEEFDEGITGSKVFTGNGKSKDLWVEKYKPQALEDLAVHKKKVEEVKDWFEGRLLSSKDQSCNFALLIAGPAGAGKSATVHTIASHFKVKVFEWNAPTPTIWHEHLHNSNSGLRYMSKLDEFESFVEKIRKYGTINEASQTLLIDDLPIVNGKIAYTRLKKSLHMLVQSICIPTIILISEENKSNSSDYTTNNWDELQLSLQKAGACKVSFNPVTANSIKKILIKICKREHCEVNSEELDLIAKASEGDIRHAITSLQYLCLKPHILSNLQENPHFGRDETISLFHALGKFLHNKRETEHIIPSDMSEIKLKEKYMRLPLKMDAPETILCQSHGQARPIADFLYENVVDFIDEEAIDDACIVSSYLSDADFLLSSLNGITSRSFEAENIVQSVAASISVRGVLFGNSHPAPPRWHSIRKPKLWQVEQSLLRNKIQMMNERYEAFNGLSLSDPSVYCTELKPALKWLEGRETNEVSLNDMMIEDETIKIETFEDEIEEDY